MALNAIFSLDCPSCGGTVPVYSATSVLVVCEYCHSNLLRSGESVSDSGTKSAVIEDFSPLQLHTSGHYQGVDFEVIGRIQVQYDRGSWDEWYIIFNDGSFGWLASFSGQYVITRYDPSTKMKLEFKRLKPGTSQIQYKGKTFIAADIRNAKSIKANAQGELPYVLQSDETVLSADFRFRNEFITLDYSNNPNEPLVFAGKMATLESLRCQFLRSDDQILATAGKLKGERAGFNCPNCGGTLRWYPGAAENVICSYCHSEISLEGGTVELLAKHDVRLAQQENSPIQIGEMAYIGGERWTVIGFVKIAELESDDAQNFLSGKSQRAYPLPDSWGEYLLYHPQKGFSWLVESEGKWELAHSMGVWPDLSSGVKPYLSNKRLLALYDYGGRVLYAVGAFYWRIEPGDVTYYQDYRLNTGKMSAEWGAEELTWSVSRPVSGKDLALWFKKPELERKSGSLLPSLGVAEDADKRVAIIAIAIYLLINLPAFFRGIMVDSEFTLLLLGLSTFFVIKVIWGPFVEDTDE